MPPAQPPPGPVEVLPTTVVRTFVERLGSYSNQAKASNIDDIVELSTEALQPRLILLADQARSNSGDGYYGVSTYVIAMNEIARDDQNVSYTVTTQRHESIDSPANTTMIYQDIQVSLVKNGVDWLVSDFQWQ